MGNEKIISTSAPKDSCQYDEVQPFSNSGCGYCYVFDYPDKGILEKYEQKISAEVDGMQQIPSLRKEIAILQKQLTALTTESIESRLHIIEENIRVGKIKPSDVKATQDLSHDLQILKTYMFRDPEELLELKQLQRNYQDLKNQSDKYIEKDDVMREVSFLNNLFFSSIGLFGLLLAVMGGSWLQSNKKLKIMDEKLAESMKEFEDASKTE